METRRASKVRVVIFDEAQELNRDTLEAIRMLSNFETPTEKLVQIVLAGQPGLSETLKKPDCDQIRQRLNCVFHLKPLDRAEVEAYIDHRLQTAGAPASLFDPDARGAIARASAGVPRNINTICFNSLSLAYALNRHQVGRAEVAEAVADLELSLSTERITLGAPETGVVQNSRVAVEQSVLPVSQSISVEMPESSSERSSEAPPQLAAVPLEESVVAFRQVNRSFRAAWIAGAMVLLVTVTAMRLG
jgi:hypothetical protein